MADNFSYLSILNPGFSTVSNTGPVAAGTFAYVSFLNPPGQGGGTTSYTTVIQGGQINGSTGDISIVGGSNITVSNNASTIEIIGAAAGTGGGIRSVSVGTTFLTNAVLPVSVETAADGMYVRIDGATSNGTLVIGNSSGFRRISAGTTYVETTGLSLNNTNGITFGLLGNTLTASHDGLTTAAQVSHSHGNPTLNLTNLTGTTASASNGLTLSLSGPPVSYLTAGANITLSTTGSTVSIIGGAGTGGGGGVAVKGSGTYSQGTGTVEFANSNGITFGLSSNGTMTASAVQSYLTAGAGITLATNGSTVSVIGNTTTTPRLDQVLDPTTDKVFAMGLNALQFQYAGGGSFSTNATRQGLFEIDVVGNLTGGADIVHIHQSVANPQIDLVHLQGAGTGVTLLRLDAAGTVAAEINAPLKFTGGSSPLILGTSQSNVVTNLNAYYLEGTRASDFAARSHSHAFATTTTNGSSIIVATTNSAGATIAVPPFITTYAAQSVQPAVGLNTAQSNVTWTVNSSGISLNAAGYAGTGTTAVNASVTLNSVGLNISVAAPGGGAAATMSVWEPTPMETGTAWASLNSATTYWAPMILDDAIAFKWVDFPISVSMAAPVGSTSATNQTYRVGYSHYFSIFSRKDYANSSGSLTYITHGSYVQTYQITQQTGNMSVSVSLITDTAGGTVQVGTTSNATANMVAALNGPRVIRMPFKATTLNPGEYYIAQAISTSGASTSATTLSNAYLISNLVISPISFGLSGLKIHTVSTAANASVGARWPIWQGVANAHTSNADMNASAISNGTISIPYVNLVNF